VARKLNAKMPKATNALHSHQISCAQACIAKSVVGRDTRAEERSGFRGPDFIRNGSQAARFSDHHFRISSIHSYSRYHGVLTVHNVSAPARFARPVFAAEETDTNALPDLPSRNVGTELLDTTYNLMSRHSRQFEPGEVSLNRCCIGMTDAASFNPDLSLSFAGLGCRSFNNPKATRRCDFDCFVCFCHFGHSPALSAFLVARA
jgi:hypothetical protein